DTGQSPKIGHQRVGDLILNLLRRPSGPVGEYDHLVLRKVWNSIDRCAQQCPIGPQAEAEVKYDDKPAIAQTHLDDPVNHYSSLPARIETRKVLFSASTAPSLRKKSVLFRLDLRKTLAPATHRLSRSRPCHDRLQACR